MCAQLMNQRLSYINLISQTSYLEYAGHEYNHENVLKVSNSKIQNLTQSRVLNSIPHAPWSRINLV